MAEDKINSLTVDDEEPSLILSGRARPYATEALEPLTEESKRGLAFQLQPGTRFLCRVVRKSLGLTQKEMAEFMGVSKKAIQSYEQRWRATPINVERLALLYLGCFKLAEKSEKIECWNVTNCPEKRREACIVWQVKRGDLCWLFSGTMCGGKKPTEWRSKFEYCIQCDVLRAVFD